MIAPLVMPQIGEDITEATVRRILVSEGQYLKNDENFIEVQTDKIDIELPSTVEGKIVSVDVKVGDIVKVNQTLIQVDSAGDAERTTRQLETQDLSTAFGYLTRLDSAYYCSRKELQDQNLTFEGFKSFVDGTAEIARAFTGLSLADLDRPLQEEIRAALFFVTDLMRMLVAFEPEKLGFKKYREHRHIYDALGKDSEFSLQILRDLLSRAGIESLEYDPSRAYVFISYSHQDAKAAFEIATKLREARIAHFMDRRTGFGEPLPTRLQDEIGRATHLIAYISPASIHSPWVHFELGFARARGVTIIPYLIHADIQLPLFIASEKHVTKDGEAQLLEQLAEHKRPVEPGRKRLVVQTFQNHVVKQRIRSAMRIWHQSMASYIEILNNEKELGIFVKGGGELWCVLSEPGGGALERSAIRNLEETSSVQRLTADFERTRRVLGKIAASAPRKDAVILKAIDFIPEPIVTIFDPMNHNGLAFVTLSGFRQAPSARPNFMLSRQEGDWFTFYCESFLALWHHPGAKTINLTAWDRLAP